MMSASKYMRNLFALACLTFFFSQSAHALGLSFLSSDTGNLKPQRYEFSASNHGQPVVIGQLEILSDQVFRFVEPQETYPFFGYEGRIVLKNETEDAKHFELIVEQVYEFGLDLDQFDENRYPVKKVPTKQDHLKKIKLTVQENMFVDDTVTMIQSYHSNYERTVSNDGDYFGNTISIRTHQIGE